VWIRRNQTEEQWDSYVSEVKMYVGFTPAKNPCHGCQTPNEKLSKEVGVHNFLRGCSARKCAFYNDFRNCAYCSRYPCDKIKSLNSSDRRRAAEERLGHPMPDDKYESFIRIFEGQKTLDGVRKGLSNDEIKEVKTENPKQSKIVDFPETDEKVGKYKPLHESMSAILSSKLGLIDTDTIAVQEMLEGRRDVLVRFLWILANYGTIKDKQLSVDSISISKHKKETSGFPTTEEAWNRFLDLISSAGINSEIELAPVDRNQLITPIGWLRDRIVGSDTPGYHIRISLNESLGGFPSLKLMQSFVKDLDEQFGKKGFAKFKKVDMRF